MHAADVEVSEVGRVGFVHVVVDFEEWGAGGREDGVEEGLGAMGGYVHFAGAVEDDVFFEAVEEADLWLVSGEEII